MKKKSIGIYFLTACMSIFVLASSFTEDTESEDDLAAKSKDCVTSNTTPNSTTVDWKGKGSKCDKVLHCAK